MRITNDYWVMSYVTWVGVLNLILRYLSECRVFRDFVVVCLTLHLRSLWHVADATCGSNLCKSLGGRVTAVGSAVLSLHVRWMAQVFHGKKNSMDSDLQGVCWQLRYVDIWIYCLQSSWIWGGKTSRLECININFSLLHPHGTEFVTFARLFGW